MLYLSTMTTKQKYNQIKKKLGVKDADIAEWFGYKNAMSFANSGEGKEKVMSGLVSVFEKIAEVQDGFFDLEDN